MPETVLRPEVASPRVGGAAVAVPFARELGRFGSRCALISTAGEWSYAQLADRVAHWRNFLGPRPRLVLVELGPDPELIAIYLAALAGGHPVLVAPVGQPDFTRELIARYDPELVFAGDRPTLVKHSTRARPHALHPDLALLLSTSGSTGSAKLVRLSADGVQANADAIRAALRLSGTDRTITSLPLHYCYGLSVLHSHLSVGASVVLTGASVVAEEFWTTARDLGVTTLAAVPYTFDVLDGWGTPGELIPTLRLLTQAGGRLAPDRVRSYATLGVAQGWQLTVMYGQTEATARMTVLDPDETILSPGSVGRPIAGGRVRVRPVPDRLDLAKAGIGELEFSGPSVMMGYADCPADLASGRETDTLKTGDLAWVDALGNVHIVGRLSRNAKVAGLRIDLDRVEARLREAGHPALCAQPANSEHLVVLTTGRNLEAVRRAAAEITRLPSHFLTTTQAARLPLLGNGKPDYSAVLASAEGFLRRPAVSTKGPVAKGPAEGLAESPVERDVRSAYAVVLGRPGAQPSDSFASLGGDSLSHVEMSVRLEGLIGALPRDWPARSIAELAERGRNHGPARATLWPRVEISVLIRALAIVLIVGSHSDVFTVMGGAHVLVALVGFNFARFVLAAEYRPTRLRQGLTLIARIALPAMVWIAAMLVLTGQYTWANVFLLNSLLGDPSWGPHWHLWFVEAVLYPLVLATLLLATPVVHRLERRAPFGLPVALTAAALLVPLGLIPVAAEPGLRFLWFGVAWLFFGGWAAARAENTSQRITVTALLLLGVPGLFDTTSRAAVLGIGLGLLVWCPALPWPRRLLRPTGWIASSSLAIYLTHWQIYPYLEQDYPLVGLLLSLLAGVLVWQLIRAVESRLARTALPDRVLAPRLPLERRPFDVKTQDRGAHGAAPHIDHAERMYV